jgi:hypothetical protein
MGCCDYLFYNKINPVLTQLIILWRLAEAAEVTIPLVVGVVLEDCYLDHLQFLPILHTQSQLAQAVLVQQTYLAHQGQMGILLAFLL